MSSKPSSRSSSPAKQYFHAPIPDINADRFSSERLSTQRSLLPRPLSPRKHISPYPPLTPDAILPPNTVFPPLGGSGPASPTFSAQTNEVLARIKEKKAKGVEGSKSRGETAIESELANMSTVGAMTAPDRPTNTTGSGTGAKTGGRRGRGPRRRGSPAARGTIKVERVMETAFALFDVPTSGRGRGRGRGSRGGRPRGARNGRGGGRGGKRKREDDDDGNEEGKEDDDTDASETFTPLPTQSRSGRKIFQANSFTPVVIIDGEHAKPSMSLTTPTKQTNVPAKRRRGGYRRAPGATAVCKNCGRGHSPSSNVIVFCDGCNTPWHQYCHDPPIEGELLQIEQQEWFCTTCTVLREEKVQLEGKVAGEGMSLIEKRQYLQSLPHPHLVSLLLHASALHPSLPIFAPPQTTKPPPPTAAITSALPASNLNDPNNLLSPLEPPADDLYYYNYYEEEDILPYPKPGNGIPLPPESEDIAFLLDEDVGAFSHKWKEEVSPGKSAAHGRAMQQVRELGIGRGGLLSVGA